MTATQEDARYLQRALDLAAHSPTPDPNPRVGAVLVRDGRIVGEGYHRGAGTPHAEIEALRDAGQAAHGATAYVSLEPCNHTGRTGPCAQALIEAGVTRVVYAQDDPNPQAAGGARTLAAAGLEVLGGPTLFDGAFARAGEALNHLWTTTTRLGRPLVTWKVAASLDGFTAADDGSSQWITGTAARNDSHSLRAQCDAIMVGTGTVLADNPRLTVRDATGALVGRQPLRVIVGDRPLPADFHIFDDAAETLLLPRTPPRDVLAALWRRGMRHVWLEGGATLAAQFMASGMVDVIVAYYAPTILGSGRPMLEGLGIATLSSALHVSVVEVERVGEDVRVTFAADGKEV